MDTVLAAFKELPVDSLTSAFTVASSLRTGLLRPEKVFQYALWMMVK